MTTTKVTVLNPGDLMHVHKAGCADIKRSPKYRLSDGWTLEVSSLQEIVEDVYGPGAGSFYEESGFTDEQIADGTAWKSYSGEFKVFPCVGPLD